MSAANVLNICVNFRTTEGKCPILQLGVVVDGELLGPGLPVDFKELYRTLKYSAEMWIFASEDGYALAPQASEFFAVHRKSSEIRWEWHCLGPIVDQHSDRSRPNMALRYATFDTARYDETLRQAWWQICSLLRSDPTMELASTDFSRTEWLSLNQWLQTSEAEPWGGEFITKTFMN